MRLKATGRLRALGATVVAVVSTSACATWQTTTEPPGALLSREAPSSVRLNVRGGAVATLRAPLMRNDSIVSGLDAGVGFPAEDVETLQVRRFSAGRTLGLAAAGLAGATLWTVGVAGSGGQDGGSDPVPKLAPMLLDGVRWLGHVLGGG